jgi:hypothetical protein
VHDEAVEQRREHEESGADAAMHLPTAGGIANQAEHRLLRYFFLVDHRSGVRHRTPTVRLRPTPYAFLRLRLLRCLAGSV